MRKHFIYIVKCEDGSLYTGSAWDLDRRINEHNTSKRGAKSLRGKLPVSLIYFEAYNSKSEALTREREIKGWSRIKKLALINNSSAPALMSVAKKRG